MIDTRPALAAIDEKRVLDLEQRSIRIPSSTFEEGGIADLYADYMSGMGLAVEMQQVAHPFDPQRNSRQPVGRFSPTPHHRANPYRTSRHIPPSGTHRPRQTERRWD